MNTDKSVPMDESRSKENSALSCKLTSPGLQKRKETIIASVKLQMIERNELPDGFAFKFYSSNQMLYELNEFIKTERECCDFFTFHLRNGEDESEIWLELRGPDGVKGFIVSELGF